jgi:hypothetical protein
LVILALKIVIIWSAAAVTLGFGAGSVIGSADRARKDAFLNAMFAKLAGKNTTN